MSTGGSQRGTVTCYQGAHGIEALYLPGEPQAFLSPSGATLDDLEAIARLQKPYLEWFEFDVFTRRNYVEKPAAHRYNQRLRLPFVLWGHVQYIAADHWPEEGQQIQRGLASERSALDLIVGTDLEILADTFDGFFTTAALVLGKGEIFPWHIAAMIVAPALIAYVQAEAVRIRIQISAIRASLEQLRTQLNAVGARIDGKTDYPTLYWAGVELQSIREAHQRIAREQVRPLQLQLERGWERMVDHTTLVKDTCWGTLGLITDGIGLFNPGAALGWKVSFFFLKQGSSVIGRATAESAELVDWEDFKADLKKLIFEAATLYWKRGNWLQLSGWKKDATKLFVELIADNVVEITYFYFTQPPNATENERAVGLADLQLKQAASAVKLFSEFLGDRSKNELFAELVKNLLRVAIEEFEKRYGEQIKANPGLTWYEFSPAMVGPVTKKMIETIPDMAMKILIGTTINYATSQAVKQAQSKGFEQENKQYLPDFLNPSKRFDVPANKLGKDFLKENPRFAVGFADIPAAKPAPRATMVPIAAGGKPAKPTQQQLMNTPPANLQVLTGHASPGRPLHHLKSLDVAATPAKKKSVKTAKPKKKTQQKSAAAPKTVFQSQMEAASRAGLEAKHSRNTGR